MFNINLIKFIRIVTLQHGFASCISYVLGYRMLTYMYVSSSLILSLMLQLDYISRLMWQAQLQGHKTWRLNPPPECEDVCQSFQFRVEPGDICEYSHPSPLYCAEFNIC